MNPQPEAGSVAKNLRGKRLPPAPTLVNCGALPAERKGTCHREAERFQHCIMESKLVRPVYEWTVIMKTFSSPQEQKQVNRRVQSMQ
eukprot:1153639-Pelagomonas_calceolata.AAC.4